MYQELDFSDKMANLRPPVPLTIEIRAERRFRVIIKKKNKSSNALLLLLIPGSIC